jgi:hypothetical protein
VAGSRAPWVARDPVSRIVDFENRYGVKLDGAEVVPVPLEQYRPLASRVEPWSK